MRPLKLYLHGFNSFYRPTEIDFEALSEGGVFGIFGNTGSGKSTIVDALIYALYGATDDRALESTDYVNRRLSKAEVRLTFALTERDGGDRLYEAYRAIAVDRVRNTAKPAKAELFDVTDARVSLAVGVRDVNAKIEELIGLNLREFSNCIILEQNEYDKFVKATDSDRKAIVGSLFGLQKFGPALQERLREREAGLAVELARVGERLGMIAATTETLKEKEAALARAERDYREEEAREARCAAEHERGRAAAENFRRRQELLQKTAECDARRKAAAETAAAANSAYAAYRASAEKESAETQRVLAECARREAQLETVRDTDARIAELTRTAETASAELTRLDAELVGYGAEETRLIAYAAAREENKRAGIRRFSALAGIDLPEDAERETELTAAVAAYVRDLDAAVRRYGELSETLRTESAEAEAKRRESEEQRRELAEIEACLWAASAAKEQASVDAETARTELDAAQKRHLAAALSEGLRVGDVCPVCGARVERTPAHAEAALDEKQAALTAAQARLREAEADIAKATERRLTADALWRRATDACRDHGTAAEAARQARAALRLDDDCGNRLAEAREIETKFSTLFAQLQTARTQRTLNAGKAELAREKRARAQADLQTAERNRAEEKARRSAVVGEGSAESAILAVASARAAAEKSKREREAQSEALRAAAERATAAAETADALYRDAAREAEALGEVRFDAEAYARITEELAASRARKEELSAQRATLRADCARMREELAARKAAEKEKAALDRQAALCDRVRKMTRGGALMEWLAEEYIQDFTALASEKLYALTDGELELGYTSKGFVVTDNFNDREERKVATVSGGETFLVSLSLAVAIAAKLEERAGARRVEFLFIDEGFGTLSQDKIDAVMDALAALGRERFTVGFISHVAEMRQRIARKLIVRREDAEVGSVAELI